jgi:hypothetical protein
VAAKRRLTVTLRREHALEATRVSIRNEKLVYVLVTDKALKYPKGKSRVAYIGTTRNGASRIAQSVAVRSYEILKIRGVRRLQARIVTCVPRKHVQTWRKLERALLLVFRKEYGEPPWCNTQGKGLRERDEFTYFRRSRIRSILDELR